jgi:hypothetical protein
MPALIQLEHSTITAWGKEHELTRTGIFTAYPRAWLPVSDSYNHNACEKLWGELLKPEIQQRKGTLVIHPRSH